MLLVQLHSVTLQIYIDNNFQSKIKCCHYILVIILIIFGAIDQRNYFFIFLMSSNIATNAITYGMHASARLLQGIYSSMYHRRHK